jgi:carboxypeptidase Q
MKYILIVLFFIGFDFNTCAQNNFYSDSVTIKKISDDVFTNGKAYENLYYLCKKIGPRLSGSKQAEAAVQATKNMLQAAGADTVYLQPCMVTHWVRKAKEVGYVNVDGKKINLHLTSLGNSEGSKGKLITAKIVEAKSFGDIKKLGSTLKGNILFINIPMNPTYVGTFRAYGEAGIGRRSGPSEAARYGAIACIVRSLASNADDYPHTGSTKYNDSFPKIPALAISTNDANMISAYLQKGKTVIASLQNDCTMLAQAPSFNVIGEIIGSEKPEEIITVGGHLDSWDLAEGAHDDGAGIVQSIEIIRVLKALHIKPKRTVRAVMFMNEENGLAGAEAYANFARINKEQHIFALESDAGGFSPRGFTFGSTSPKKLSTLLSWAKLFYNYGVYECIEGSGGADIEPLAKQGVTVAGLRVDSQRYFDVHHAATDVFESVNKRELHLGAINMAALVWMVSEYGL